MDESNVRSADALPKQRWYQFRLRTMLILVLICSLPCAWFSYRLQKAHRQHAAVQQLLRHGGTVTYDFEVDSEGSIAPLGGVKRSPPYPAWLVELLGQDSFGKVVRADSVTNELMPQVDELPDLLFLRIGADGNEPNCVHNPGDPRPAITDAGLAHLRGLKQLKTLIIVNSTISCEGYQALKQLSSLRTLDIPFEHPCRKNEIPNTKVSEVTLRKLREMLPNCEIFDVD